MSPTGIVVEAARLGSALGRVAGRDHAVITATTSLSPGKGSDSDFSVG